VKICDITQFYSPLSGGVRRYVEARQRYINTLNRHHQILIVPDARSERSCYGRSIVYRIQSPRIDRSCNYRAILDFEAVKEILRAEKPDLIECADPYQLAWLTLHQSHQLKIPAVAFYHSHFPELWFAFVSRFGSTFSQAVAKYSRLYVTDLYSKFRRTLVPSAKLADVLASWGIANVVPVRLGVDTDVFTPGRRNEEKRKELNVRPDQLLLLYVGRLGYEKNLNTLIHAFELIDREWPGKYRLHLIGDGPLKPELLRHASSNPRMTVQPYISNSEELACSYLAADIFVHPGINETFGLVTLEAQACDLPVIGIRGTFMDELALTGSNRWAAENSPDALANAISEFARLPACQANLKTAHLVQDRYSWGTVFNDLFNVYESVLSLG
jgi:alpha-1,6-mannosyltransferase